MASAVLRQSRFRRTSWGLPSFLNSSLDISSAARSSSGIVPTSPVHVTTSSQSSASDPPRESSPPLSPLPTSHHSLPSSRLPPFLLRRCEGTEPTSSAAGSGLVNSSEILCSPPDKEAAPCRAPGAAGPGYRDGTHHCVSLLLCAIPGSRDRDRGTSPCFPRGPHLPAPPPSNPFSKIPALSAPHMSRTQPCASSISGPGLEFPGLRAASAPAQHRHRERQCQSQLRHHSSNSDKKQELSELEYHRVADNFLHSLHEELDVLVDKTPGNGEFDCDYSDGVLTLRLPPHGVFVLNKQAPNKQIWLSSPVSGPARYEWSEEKLSWVNARDENTKLVPLLQEELSSLLHMPVSFSLESEEGV